ncbi:SIR2 family protein [Sphingomonas sp. ZT3P38]|uniref:SIR2 family protein n=1 Tax=Parasphingomonas zepuensis TaxID=3096161 RepID=UPI002FC9AA4B
MTNAALDISIGETLALLDGDFAEFAAGVANDQYAMWLGSGISLAKFPGLEGVVQIVLEHLQAKVDPVDPQCVFRRSLDRILTLVNLTAEEWQEADYAKPVADWRDRERICKGLTGAYAPMLDQHPEGTDPDYLIWTAIDVVGRYGDLAVTPGPEHLGLAALIAEGAASDTASANWDPLIERAAEHLVGTAPGLLQVRVVPEDVKDSSARARLYKFHGCAVLAGIDWPLYRDKIVGRASQIHGWEKKNKVIAGKLLDLAISKSTLMLGLSTQDTNIQTIFVGAQENLPAAFPTHPPAVVLSENTVGGHQLSLLQNFYQADYANKRQAIETSALLRSYGQSLLPALWLHVVCAKLEAYAATAAPALPGPHIDRLRAALRELRDGAAAAAAANAQEAYMLAALPVAGRTISLFRDGKPLGPTAGVYTPLSINGLGRSLADPNLPSSGLPQLALAAALLGHGQVAGAWSCSISDPADPKSGALQVTGKVQSAEVFFAANAQAASRIVADGRAAENDNAIIVHSHEIPPAAPRNPKAAPGRILPRGRREISLAKLAEGATDLDALFMRFKSEIRL